MTSDLTQMIEELKKEISENLTRKINMPNVNVASSSNYDEIKKREKKKKMLSFVGIVLSAIVIITSLLFIKADNSKGIKINNNIDVNIVSSDKDFEYYNDNKNTYLASLVDKINIDFENIVNANGYQYDKRVTTSVIITDANDDNMVIFKNSEKIVSDVKGIWKNNNDNKISVSLDYSKYNKEVNNYKKRISIVNNARLEVVYTNKINVDGKEKTIKQKVAIPLSKDVVSYMKEYSKQEYINSEKDINYVCLVTIVIGAALFIASVVYLIINIKNNVNSLSVLERKYQKIMKNYSSIIIEVEDDSFKDKLAVISVKYFIDLIDAQQELHVPILCYTDPSKELTTFYIVADKYVYKYILNKSEEQL